MPVVVFLHGFTGSARDWDAIIRDGTGLFKSYAIDLPGHGENIHHENQDAYSFLGAAKIAADSIKQITNTPVHLVGYSMGGRIAIYVALRWPTLFASLIIESATAGLSDHDSRQKRMCVDSKLAKQIFSMSIDEFLSEWYSQPLFASLSNEQKENIIHARLENNVLELGKSLEGLSIGAQPSLWDRRKDGGLVQERTKRYRSECRA